MNPLRLSFVLKPEKDQAHQGRFNGMDIYIMGRKRGASCRDFAIYIDTPTESFMCESGILNHMPSQVELVSVQCPSVQWIGHKSDISTNPGDAVILTLTDVKTKTVFRGQVTNLSTAGGLSIALTAPSRSIRVIRKRPPSR